MGPLMLGSSEEKRKHHLLGRPDTLAEVKVRPWTG